jgi:hypothetical protein
MRIVRIAGDAGPVELLRAGATEFPLRRSDMATLSIALAPDASFVVGDGAGDYLVRRYSAEGKLLGEIRRAVAKVRRTPDELMAMAIRKSEEIGKMQALMGRPTAAPPVSTEGIPVERD